MQTSITIEGRIPSKKNSRNVFSRGGKLFNIPSKKYKEWHSVATLQISEFENLQIEEVSSIDLKFYAPDRRSADLTNKAESVLDLLVDNGVIIDDNWFVLKNVNLYFQGVDKERPRCEVIIHS